MSTDVSDLRSTIIPKSDQLNSEQLLGAPMTVTVTDVRIGSSDEQPISVHYEGEAGRPFKPCKTMRKVLIFAWGPDGREWIGRSMTLYNDPQVRFGGAEVGGIRISHMTDISGQIKVSLTATKGKKALHTIDRMERPATAGMLEQSRLEDWRTAIAAAGADEIDAIAKEAAQAATDARDRDAYAVLRACVRKRKDDLAKGSAS